MTPSEFAAATASATHAGIETPPPALPPALVAELWRTAGASAWGLDAGQFAQILLEVGIASNFGLSPGEAVTPNQQAIFFGRLCLADLVLARTCAQGHERAWQYFVATYRQPLIRAAIAITGSETLGRDLADQLYAELYGLTTSDHKRRCPLASYRGRGSLMGWLRTVLAQRHVDHHRRTRREEPLDDLDVPVPGSTPAAAPAQLALLQRAIESALRDRNPEERFLLAAYYLDGQTLFEIGRVLGVHEATASRRLQRITKEIRKQVLGNLERSGISRRAAEETMGIDPRDLDLNLKKLLQKSQTDSFNEQAAEQNPS
jgi:RNA polymerase sigma-70 factor, ECF subfamily